MSTALDYPEKDSKDHNSNPQKDSESSETPQSTESSETPETLQEFLLKRLVTTWNTEELYANIRPFSHKPDSKLLITQISDILGKCVNFQDVPLCESAIWVYFMLMKLFGYRGYQSSSVSTTMKKFPTREYIQEIGCQLIQGNQKAKYICIDLEEHIALSWAMIQFPLNYEIQKNSCSAMLRSPYINPHDVERVADILVNFPGSDAALIAKTLLKPSIL